MNKFLIKKLFFIFILCSHLILVAAEEILNKTNATWSTVLPGVVLCRPVETSYGFCIVTDARDVIAYSKDGQQIWEKSIGRSRNVELSVLKDDFLVILEKNENKLKILNPSGNEIWTKALDFFPRERALVGYDGRFYVYSENKICCFGINGICKWEKETPHQKNIPVQQLPDGSLVIFLSETQGKTLGLRISPFGEEIEEITFAGEVKSSYSCKDGILLVFADGSAGLFSIQEGFAKNKWVLPKKSDNGIFVVSVDLSEYFYIEQNSNNVIINKINSENGNISYSKKIEDLNGEKLVQSYFNDAGLFLCDNKKAFLFNSNGTELYAANMPEIKQQNWNYIFNLNDNYLVFCNKDWSLTAFRISQSAGKSVSSKSNNNYNSFYQLDMLPFNVVYTQDFGNQLTAEERTIALEEGNYGDLEKKYLSEVISICNIYNAEISSSDFGTRKEKSIFDLDVTGFQNILKQLSLFCNDNTQNIAANIIKKSSNRNYSLYLINNVTGYDPDGDLLKALETKSVQITPRDVNYINSICDLVYEICCFMGRPAYNTKGKKILKQFLGSNYDVKNRKYASDTLRKIIALEL